MKRLILICLFISGISILLVSGWPKVDEDISSEVSVEKRSIFISYIELSKYLNGKSESVARDNVNEMVNNVAGLGFNQIILQVRSFSDAIYESSVYPWSRVVSNKEGEEFHFDVLEEFIKKSKERDVSVIAWINPYRVRNDEDISNLSWESIIYKYIGTDYLYINDGIYLNPSKEEIRDLIVKGVEEIVSKYDVAGVLFDDYFYPDNEIDMNDYKEYLKTNAFISKSQYNLNIVSELIKEVHSVCKKYGVLFGVSPDGNIENNYNKVFADVKKWCGSDEYVDFIMPQVYYGFFNETKAFKKVIEEWESIITNKDIEFNVALAFYKVGCEDKWAKSGSNEWIENGNIIMREIVLSRNLEGYSGFSLFRYDYLFNSEMYTAMTMSEIENMKKVLN